MTRLRYSLESRRTWQYWVPKRPLNIGWCQITIINAFLNLNYCRSLYTDLVGVFQEIPLEVRHHLKSETGRFMKSFRQLQISGFRKAYPKTLRLGWLYTAERYLICMCRPYIFFKWILICYCLLCWHSWSVYRLESTERIFLGIVDPRSVLVKKYLNTVACSFV